MMRIDFMSLSLNFYNMPCVIVSLNTFGSIKIFTVYLQTLGFCTIPMVFQCVFATELGLLYWHVTL